MVVCWILFWEHASRRFREVAGTEGSVHLLVALKKEVHKAANRNYNGNDSKGLVTA
jgi:hypothetical protein